MVIRANRIRVLPRHFVTGLFLASISAHGNASGHQVPSLHVSYSGDAPIARTTYNSIRKSLEGACGGKVDVSGDTHDLGKMRSDVYYSRDGAYVAHFENRYIATPTGRCALAIRSVQRKLLYHLKSGTLYRFEESGKRGPRWQSTPLPGGKVALFMEAPMVPGIGHISSTGKTGKFAGLNCTYSELRLSEERPVSVFCDHDLTAEHIRIPTHIRLESSNFNAINGDLVTHLKADTIELNTLVEASLYQPGKSASAPKPGMAPAMLKWCEKQLRTTGTNPCKDDPEDDED